MWGLKETNWCKKKLSKKKQIFLFKNIPWEKLLVKTKGERSICHKNFGHAEQKLNQNKSQQKKS